MHEEMIILQTHITCHILSPTKANVLQKAIKNNSRHVTDWHFFQIAHNVTTTDIRSSGRGVAILHLQSPSPWQRQCTASAPDQPTLSRTCRKTPLKLIPTIHIQLALDWILSPASAEFFLWHFSQITFPIRNSKDPIDPCFMTAAQF